MKLASLDQHIFPVSADKSYTLSRGIIVSGIEGTDCNPLIHFFLRGCEGICRIHYFAPHLHKDHHMRRVQKFVPQT